MPRPPIDMVIYVSGGLVTGVSTSLGNPDGLRVAVVDYDNGKDVAPEDLSRWHVHELDDGRASIGMELVASGPDEVEKIMRLAGAESTTPPSPSVLVLANPAAPSDNPIPVIAERWAAAGWAEAELQDLWSKVERSLIEHFGWARLTEEEQKALPEAQELFALDARLDAVETERRRCREDLIRLPARTLGDLLAKVQVAVDTIDPTDNDPAHRLLASIRRDLEELTAPYRR